MVGEEHREWMRLVPCKPGQAGLSLCQVHWEPRPLKNRPGLLSKGWTGRGGKGTRAQSQSHCPGSLRRVRDLAGAEEAQRERGGGMDSKHTVRRPRLVSFVCNKPREPKESFAQKPFVE